MTEAKGVSPAGTQARGGASIIIAVWNQAGYTRLGVESILRNTKTTPFEFVIVDNGSKPDVRAYFDSIKGAADINYIRNETNLGPIRAINQGIKAAKYDYVVIIHNDVVIMEEDWLAKIVSAMEKDPKIGIAGLAGRKEIYDTGCVNEASLKHNLQNEDLNAPMGEDVAEVAVIDGLCFVMKRDLLNKTSGLDETYGYMHCYDLDISLQSIDAGFKNVIVKVAAMHLGNGGMTRKLREYKELVKDDYGLLKKNCKVFSRKWRHMLPIKIA
ncbi:MAG: glycosyltransferase [Candidatus Omnitrophica bacterium]|nr:glycosyltransferase [Candidatus Omnitrophota bacterium]